MTEAETKAREKALRQAAELVVAFNIYHGFEIASEILALPEDAEEYEND